MRKGKVRREEKTGDRQNETLLILFSSWRILKPSSSSRKPSPHGLIYQWLTKIPSEAIFHILLRKSTPELASIKALPGIGKQKAKWPQEQITCGGWGGCSTKLVGVGRSAVQALEDSAMLWPPAASALPSTASAGTGEACFLTQFSPQSLFSCSLVMLLACQSDTAAGSAVCYNKFTVPSKFSGKVLCWAA